MNHSILPAFVRSLVRFPYVAFPSLSRVLCPEKCRSKWPSVGCNFIYACLPTINFFCLLSYKYINIYNHESCEYYILKLLFISMQESQLYLIFKTNISWNICSTNGHLSMLKWWPPNIWHLLDERPSTTMKDLNMSDLFHNAISVKGMPLFKVHSVRPADVI